MWYFIGLVGFHHFTLTDVMQNVLSGRLDPSVPIMIRNVFVNTQTLNKKKQLASLCYGCCC